MTVFEVSYSEVDPNAYFCGYMNYSVCEHKLFSTREKAEEFKAKEIIMREPWMTFDLKIKEAGEGDIYEVEVE